MSFLLNKLEKEPKIVALENSINFVGLSIKTDMKNIVTTQVQGSIVPGSGLINIQNRGFQTVNPES